MTDEEPRRARASEGCGCVLLLGLVLAAVYFTAGGNQGAGAPGATMSDVINRATYTNGRWPLTVDSARLACIPPVALVVHADGDIYPLNGTAANLNQARGMGWAPIEEIWAFDETVGSDGDPTLQPRIPLGGLISEAHLLCGTETGE